MNDAREIRDEQSDAAVEASELADDSDVLNLLATWLAETLSVPRASVSLESPSVPGVSAQIYYARTPRGSFVVKAPLRTLKTSRHFSADRSRLWNEALGLSLAAIRMPQTTPGVLGASLRPPALLLSFPEFPTVNLREYLLAQAFPGGSLFTDLGAWLATIHQPDGLSWLEGTGMRQLLFYSMQDMRINPFYLPVVDAFPQLAGYVSKAIRDLEEAWSPVHGDYSPKNILVSREFDHFWVLDFEGFHIGNPGFDVASMVHHLILKSIIQRSPGRPQLIGAISDFLNEYERKCKMSLSYDVMVRHVAILLLARVVGLSPAPYLTDPDKERAVALGLNLARSGIQRASELLREVEASWERSS